jgi:hypothetical protein
MPDARQLGIVFAHRADLTVGLDSCDAAEPNWLLAL